jgi:DNA polymerase-1
MIHYFFDLETHLFGPCNMAPKPVSFAVKRIDAVEEDTQLELFNDARKSSLYHMLHSGADNYATLIGHHVAYDMACTFEHAPELRDFIWRAYELGKVQCTKVRERLLDIATGSKFDEDEEGALTKKKYSLAHIARTRLKMDLDKESDTRTTYAQWDGISIDRWPRSYVDYAKKDVDATSGVWLSQEESRKKTTYSEEEWNDEVQRQSAFSFALQLMSCRGLETDLQRVDALRQSIVSRMLATIGEMREVGIIRAKGTKDLGKIRELVEQSWVGDGDVPKTKGGQVATAADVIEQCNHPILKKLVEYNWCEKVGSGFVDKMARGVVHPSFEVLGAETGRTSSHNPNIQQQHKKGGIRECFKARAGFVFISCDFDSQELRTLAQVLKSIFGRSALADKYSADPDYDPHTDFAAGMLRIKYAEGIAKKKARDAEFKEWRQRAKAANFGFPGGLGVSTFIAYARGYGLELDRPAAEELKQQYLSHVPEMGDYFGMIQNMTEGGRADIKLLFSQRRRGQCKFTQVANSYFQGLASDASKNALWEVTKHCYGAPGYESSALRGSFPVMFAHDEIMIEAPESRAHECAVLLDNVMCRAMEELTPDVPARASPALMRHWTKEAEAVFDRDGRYICWEDREK